jgi:flagellar protein FliO/FliZ
MMRFILIGLLLFSVLASAQNQDIPATGAVSAEAEMALATTTNTKLAEDQIPLTIAEDRKNAASGTSATKAMMSAFIVIALIGTSYYFVRKYKISNTVNKSNMKIKVLTQHYLGPKKSLAIVHVAGESILIGVTDQNISMIKSLSLIDDEVPSEMPQTFSESLSVSSGVRSQALTGAAAQQPAAAQMTDELDEEFSFAGVTDSVSKKIKSMRSFS